MSQYQAMQPPCLLNMVMSFEKGRHTVQARLGQARCCEADGQNLESIESLYAFVTS